MKFNNSKFKNDLVLHRKRLGATLRDVSEDTGLSFGNISRVERGQTPNLDTFLSLCEAMNFNPCKYFIK